MAKKVLIGFRGTDKEKSYLETRSKANGFENVSDFLRAKLFEDNVEMTEELEENSRSKKPSHLEVDLIKMCVGTYNLVNRMAAQKLSEKEMIEEREKAKNWLEKKGYNSPKNPEEN